MAEKMNSIQVYVTDVGNVVLPADFPMSAFRKNGLPDRRRKIAAKLREYTEDLEAGALKLWQAGKDVRGLRAMSWAEWQSKKS